MAKESLYRQIYLSQLAAMGNVVAPVKEAK